MKRRGPRRPPPCRPSAWPPELASSSSSAVVTPTRPAHRRKLLDNHAILDAWQPERQACAAADDAQGAEATIRQGHDRRCSRRAHRSTRPHTAPPTPAQHRHLFQNPVQVRLALCPGCTPLTAHVEAARLSKDVKEARAPLARPRGPLLVLGAALVVWSGMLVAAASMRAATVQAVPAGFCAFGPHRRSGGADGGGGAGRGRRCEQVLPRRRPPVGRVAGRC